MAILAHHARWRDMPKVLRKLGGPWPLVIFLAALAYRAVYFWTVRGDPLMTYVDAIPDAWLYHHWAVNILEGAKGVGAYYIGPAYAFFLAAVYRLFGLHLYAVIFVQLALDAATAVLVYALAKRLFGPLAGKVAGLIWAFYLPILFFDTQILPPAMTLFLVTASLYTLTLALEEGRGRRWAVLAAGAIFGLVVLARPNLLLFVPAFALWPLLGKVRPWRALVLFAIPVLVVVGAVTVRNKVVADDWVLISSQGGINFFIGNNEESCGAFTPPPGTMSRPEDMNDAATRVQAERALGRKLKPSEASRWWFQRGLTFLAENPGKAARLYGTKVSILTNSYEVTLNTDFNFRGTFSPLHRLRVPYFGLIFAFGVFGLAIGSRGGSPGRSILTIFALATSVSVIIFFVADWYRLPLVPALAAGAGFAVDRLVSHIRSRRWASLSFGGAAVGLLLTYSWLPGVGIDRDAVWTQSYHNYGTYYLVEGDAARAAEYFRRALHYKNDNVYALVYLGLAYEKQGQEEAARDCYIRALAMKPDEAEANYYLALNLVRAGNVAGAIPFLEAAATASPGDPDAWRLLGECYFKTQDFANASRALEKAAALAPLDADLRVKYATALMATGRYDQGLAAVDAALRLKPDVSGAHNLSGKYYFRRGDLARAADEFRREVELSPGAADPHAYLAEYYYQTGNAAAGRAEYERYRQLGGPPIGRFEDAPAP